MTDLLMTAARKLGVPTEVSAGPGRADEGMQIWARWPRHRLEVAQDVLNQMTQLTEGRAKVTPIGATPLWRARRGKWTYIGRFEEAVAQLALHVSETGLFEQNEVQHVGEYGRAERGARRGAAQRSAAGRRVAQGDR